MRIKRLIVFVLSGMFGAVLYFADMPYYNWQFWCWMIPFGILIGILATIEVKK